MQFLVHVVKHKGIIYSTNHAEYDEKEHGNSECL